MMAMRFVPVLLAAVCLLSNPARADTTDAQDDFFGAAKIHRIHLKLSAHAWKLIEPERRPRPAPLIAAEMPPPSAYKTIKPALTTPPQTPTPNAPGVEGEVLAPNNFGWAYVYVKARFECDGKAIDNVGLRFKGNASFDNAPDSYKKPYKIDFNRFVLGQQFHGMTALNLSNNAFDSSLLREALSYYCYTKGGVHAPRTALVLLYLTIEGTCNHEYVGLFTAVEEPDDRSFLKANFDTTRGVLFKPEGMRGLPYLGERVEPYVERYRAKTDADPQLVRRFIDFVKLVNYADDAEFAAKIEEYFDVDEMLRNLAVTVLISNLDSYLVTNHNFYLYVHPKDKRVRLLPWDMNLSFGGYQTPGSADNQIHLSIVRPWAGDHNRLLDRLMAIPEYQCAYRAYLWQFMEDFFNPEHMSEVVGAMEASLADARKAEAGAVPNRRREFNANAWVFGETEPFRTYVTRKTKVVRAQLDGNMTTAYVPRPNPPFAFRWGVRADQAYGNLALMAKAIRYRADADGDFKLSPRELRDATAAFFYDLVDESKPGKIHLKTAAAGLDPLVSQQEATGRGFWGVGRKDAGTAGFIWARAIFRDADEDLDGHVSLDEATAFVMRLFCECDEDRDGLLNEREIIEALDLIAAPPDPGQDAAETWSRRRR
jgi:spore coat protein CotH